uniref:Uncharacterized protein n=1 Tax=Cacopsylla melanoneura TaxID=428564 RepID=A0A8D8YXR2_9HEMI
MKSTYFCNEFSTRSRPFGGLIPSSRAPKRHVFFFCTCMKLFITSILWIILLHFILTRVSLFLILCIFSPLFFLYLFFLVGPNPPLENEMGTNSPFPGPAYCCCCVRPTKHPPSHSTRQFQ